MLIVGRRSVDEDAFRVGKSDLGLRPVYHHREDRVQAHILVCFLALAMWRCLEMWLKAKGLGDCGRQVLEEINTIRWKPGVDRAVGYPGWFSTPTHQPRRGCGWFCVPVQPLDKASRPWTSGRIVSG